MIKREEVRKIADDAKDPKTVSALSTHIRRVAKLGLTNINILVSNDVTRDKFIAALENSGFRVFWNTGFLDSGDYLLEIEW